VGFICVCYNIGNPNKIKYLKDLTFLKKFDINIFMVGVKFFREKADINIKKIIKITFLKDLTNLKYVI